MPGRPKPPPDQVVGLNHEFPPDLVEALVALPQVEASPAPVDDSEPPSKKLKLGSPLESKLIASNRLEIARRCSDSSSTLTSVCRQDDGRHVRLISLSGDRLGITVKRPGKSGSRPYKASIALPSGLDSRELAASMQVLGREAKDDEGALWVSLEVRLEWLEKTLRISLGLDLYWNTTTSPFNLRNTRRRDLSELVLSTFFPAEEDPGGASSKRNGWTPLDFYEAAFVPSPEDTASLDIEVPGLGATLYPYQRRTLQWLLNREGVSWAPGNDNSGPCVVPNSPQSGSPDARSFHRASDINGEGFALSRLYHAIATDTSQFTAVETSVKGGILSEEMGLGKTLEIIGLILTHRREMANESPFVELHGEQLIRSPATIIVCPESLRQQWMTELQRHAPHLQVTYYKGRGHVDNDDEEGLTWDLATHDVVVTTYNTLSAEIHYANKPPDRSRRFERAYQRPKSPLVQISWWRVCLDEAQMIESGVSSAALVARVLPRINAWGVTGTPVKNDVKDLLGLLLFLRYEPYSSAPQVWKALTDHHKPIFRGLFKDLAIRHTKRMVRDELEIPAQKRFVITMPFTAVEEQHYRSLFAEMADACGLDVEGTPKVEDWNPRDYEELMRTWLNRLRQTALHPEVGAMNRRALGRKSGPLRTVDEVLNAMIEQSDASIRTEQRVYLSIRLTHGQMLENGPRVKEAQTIWESVQDASNKIVQKCREELKSAIQEAKDAGGENPADNASNSDDEDDAEDAQNKGRVGEARMRLRLALEVLHRAVFFCANAHYQIKSNTDWTVPESDEFKALQKLEDEGYEAAKKIRREILSENHQRATKHVRRLQNNASSQDFVSVPELLPNPTKGLESSPVIEKIEELYEELNAQANIIDDWREAIIQLLSRALVDQEDDIEITGEEFADSTKIQEELMVHVQVLRAMVADRQHAISGLENALVKHEIQTSKALANEGGGPAPETFLKLLELRDGVKPSLEVHGSLRGAVGELRALAARFPRSEGGGEGRAHMEHEIIVRQLKDTQAQIQAQTKACQALERESDRFTSAMNSRLDYYRQLQSVSDSVEAYEGPTDDHTIAKCVESEEVSRKKLDYSEAKHRYLLSLRESGSKSSEPRMCIICQSNFTTGILTVCGHQFCKECMMLWFRAHHNCPMCKRKLRMSELHAITLKTRELKLHTQDGQENAQDQEPKRSPTSKKTGIYTEFGTEKLAEINDIDLEGPSFTTKVDSIVRHILWLRESDPGAKSIIFSQYRDFLGVIGLALSRSQIGYSSIDKPNGIQRFKEDAGVECFLLHGRAQSSGLNLVNASHVFLCEPVLNTALELQAIARVDRIGQQHQTTVWLYLIEGTVEESIYNLSVQRRMEHMGKMPRGKSKESTPEVLEPALEEANTLEMEQASLSKLMSKDKTAGEAVEAGDLWECLFGHVAKLGKPRDEEAMLEDPAIRGFLAAEAAEQRQREQENVNAGEA